MTPGDGEASAGHGRGTRFRRKQLRQIERARRLITATEGGPEAVAALLGCSAQTDALYPAAFGWAIERIRDLLTILEDEASPDLYEWSTAEELCTWLRIAKSALNWMNTTDQGPRRHRIGRENRYRRRDVEQWLGTRALLTG